MELLVEFLLQFFVELGYRTIISWFGIEFKFPLWCSYLGYAFAGTLLGIISVGIFPQHLITNYTARIINLILSPFLIGYGMRRLGITLKNHDKKVTRLDTFTCGTLFAFFFALMRFLYLK